MYPKLVRYATLRQPVFLPMASSWSTSGRLASLRLPRIATMRLRSSTFLDHARRGVRPLPDDLLAIEKIRVGGGRDFSRARSGAVIRLQLGANKTHRDRNAFHLG